MSFLNAPQTSVPAQQEVALPGSDCETSVPGQSGYNAEASASIPFGIVVKAGAAAGALLLPSGSGDEPEGIVLYSSAYDSSGLPGSDLDSTGVKPKARISYKVRGIVWVKPEAAVSPGDPVFARHSTGAGGSQKGALRSNADSATAIDLGKRARFLDSSAANGGYSRVRFDFRNRP